MQAAEPVEGGKSPPIGLQYLVTLSDNLLLLLLLLAVLYDLAIHGTEEPSLWAISAMAILTRTISALVMTRQSTSKPPPPIGEMDLQAYQPKLPGS